MSAEVAVRSLYANYSGCVYDYETHLGYSSHLPHGLAGLWQHVVHTGGNEALIEEHGRGDPGHLLQAP